jgi:hypothetical protein
MFPERHVGFAPCSATSGDWVVVVVVPLGAAIAALTLLVAWIALRRGGTHIIFRDASCEPANGDPNQVDAGVTVAVDATGTWRRRRRKGAGTHDPFGALAVKNPAATGLQRAVLMAGAGSVALCQTGR